MKKPKRRVRSTRVCGDPLQVSYDDYYVTVVIGTTTHRVTLKMSMFDFAEFNTSWIEQVDILRYDMLRECGRWTRRSERLEVKGPGR
jgi:hypothetical protein